MNTSLANVFLRIKLVGYNCRLLNVSPYLLLHALGFVQSIQEASVLPVASANADAHGDRLALANAEILCSGNFSRISAAKIGPTK